MHVIFSHGKEAHPAGEKILALTRVATQLGFTTESIDYRDQRNDPEGRVARLLAAADNAPRPLVLVGSSMGGYVSAVASASLRPQGMLLLAPAIGLPGYADPDPQPCADHLQIVHGWMDEIAPVQNVTAYAFAHAAPLCVLPDGHRLLASMTQIEMLFAQLLQRVAADHAQASAVSE
ncbi:alpha/beta fold hydrolase [Magnetofaba australis]|uniref:Putative alpha/beta fold family hydrolase n=1 Tax=Magnetofaba australis IT-1 TaxID=1434232 RepID=A0A1Y2KAW7_9PROT|nr:alpha/beta fold hydrolase [Magnetofaba australis]OSM07074.1 putative alpha/beta fold family hydrolase [Magnetofaba australis IT-1]